MSTIRELRLSFTWFERWGDIWSGGKPIAMDFLRSASEYAKEFDRMMSETVQKVDAAEPVDASRLTATALNPPWPYTTPQYRHWFWRYFLRVEPGGLSGNDAFQNLVPFQTRFPARIRSAKGWIRILTDGFVYPHGTGLAVTLRLYFDRGAWPIQGIALEEAVQNAVEAFTREVYEGTREDGSGTSGKTFKGNVDTLANILLDQLRTRVLGSMAPSGVRTARPFSVASVIRGDTNLIRTPPVEGGDVHVALQALGNLRDNWQNDNPEPFATSLLRRRQSAPKGHLLYRTSQGRTVWFPASFTSTERFCRKVGCYHRNLSLLHLQTEALIQALAARADMLARKNAVPEELKAICKLAATGLQTIYASEVDTYRSSSPRKYIDENPAVKRLVNDARKDFGLDALKYEEAAT